jgi:tRNA dimethylallyltransferase
LSYEDRILAIVGPTAIGKTDVAIRIALEADGEIVNTDSRQVYKYMDIGTAKPTVDQRSSVPHHLIDVVYPDDDFNLGLFLDRARRTINDIFERSKLPILVGGSGQYIWGLLEGWQVPQIPPNSELRISLERRIRKDGLATVYKELTTLSPESASRIDASNPRRVIRALEIYYSSGKQANTSDNIPPPFSINIAGLCLERSDLYRRAENRIDRMIENGWVKEVEQLLAMGYNPDLPSMSSLGYTEICEHLRGITTIDQAINKTKSRTRKFIRHQNSWFKKSDCRINWIENTSPETIQEILLMLT